MDLFFHIEQTSDVDWGERGFVLFFILHSFRWLIHSNYFIATFTKMWNKGSSLTFLWSAFVYCTTSLLRSCNDSILLMPPPFFSFFYNQCYSIHAGECSDPRVPSGKHRPLRKTIELRSRRGQNHGRLKPRHSWKGHPESQNRWNFGVSRRNMTCGCWMPV